MCKEEARREGRKLEKVIERSDLMCLYIECSWEDNYLFKLRKKVKIDLNI